MLRLIPLLLILLLPTLLLSFAAGPARAQSAAEAVQALPTAERVVADMGGTATRATAARSTAALQVLEGMVRGLAGPRAANGRLTPAEQARLDDYTQAAAAIWAREYERKMGCEGEHCERYLYAQCAQSHVFSAPFYRELLDRYVPPAWQAAHVPRLQGQLWKTALALPAGTRMPAEVAQRLPCAGVAELVAGAITAPGAARESLMTTLLGRQARADNPRYQAFVSQLTTVSGVTLAVLALWLFGYLRQFGKRVTLDSADPLRLVAPASRELHSVTGEVLGTSKGIQTTTTTYTQDNRVTGQSSSTVVHDQFFIRTPEGREEAVKLSGVDVAVRNGQQMSAVWHARRGKREGRYLLLRNHTLREVRHFDDSAGELLGMRGRYGWLLLLTLLAYGIFLALSVDWWLGGSAPTLIATLLIPVFVVLSLVMIAALALTRRQRLRRLRRELEKQLVPALDRRAAEQGADFAPAGPGQTRL